MLHWYCKVTIILRKTKNAKETIIVRQREYKIKLSRHFHVHPFHVHPHFFSKTFPGKQ